MFSDYSTEVIGFPSTWKHDQQTSYRNVQTDTDPMPKKSNQSTMAIDKIHAAVQTEFDTPSTMPMTHKDEQKLAEWLRKILPLVEKELSNGVTNVYEFEFFHQHSNISINFMQTLSVTSNDGYNDIDNRKDSSLYTHGVAAWLSLSTQNAPILAIAGSFTHNTWCDHSNEEILFFTPKRNKFNSDNVTYEEFKRFSVKSCIKTIVTNPFNKDMIVGGTVSGDIYIWSYEQNHDGGNVVETFSDTTQYGSIVDATWIKGKLFGNEYELLTCHKDGYVLLWKIGINNVGRDKIFRINNRQSVGRMLSLTTILAISSTEFVVGSDEGNISLCSKTNANHTFDNSKDLYDPTINELESHKFSVSTLYKCSTGDKFTFISSDISGEVFFHQIDELSEPFKTIKIPLPFKSKITFTKDLEHILSPGLNGTLDVYTLGTAAKKTIEGYNVRGLANAIEISANGRWLVTCYEGDFQIYFVTKN